LKEEAKIGESEKVEIQSDAEQCFGNDPAVAVSCQSAPHFSHSAGTGA
jgi:hypothetical protein